MIKNNFIKNIFILASGAAIAQIINLAVIPLITRQYGPYAYGLMGGFMSVVNILIPLSALSYPIAVVLPKKNKQATILVRLCLTIGVLMSLISILLLIIGGVFFSEAFSNHTYPIWYWAIFPLIILILPFQQASQQWLVRNGKYKKIASISILQAIIVNFFRVTGGLLIPLPVTLIIITALGYVLQSTQFFIHALKSGLSLNKSIYNWRKTILAAKQYKDFPIYRTPQVLINSISQSLPIFIIGYYFGVSAAGFYALAQTILGAPVTLLSSAISSVYYPRISNRINKKEPVFIFISKSIFSLMLLSLIIYSVIILWGPQIFIFTFGNQWEMAGEFGRWMAFYCIFWLAARPAIDSIPPLKIQHYFLTYEIIALILKALALFIGAVIIKSELGMMILFSIANAIAYLSLSIMVIIMAKVLDQKNMEDRYAS
jgi:O-antigen/teichoic acid export membrane protein